MPRPLQIVPFADDHLDAAAALLAERHRRHRAAEPLLPDVGDFRTELEVEWSSEGASGVAALRDDELVGYLVGAPRDDAVWGANVWVGLGGHAVAEPEVARDLYGGVAEQWVAAGRTRHYAIVPASDEALVEAWFRLGFGQQHALGIRELPQTTALPAGVREAEERDVDAMVALAPLLAEHQERSPVFARGPRRESEDELRKDILEDLASPDVGNLLAEVDGRIVGNFVVVPLERSSMHTGLARPPHASFLAWAATLPAARGSGAGVALTEGCFAWARARGYGGMTTDWRVTNLLSSRFWPRRGFHTTFLRLYRSIP